MGIGFAIYYLGNKLIDSGFGLVVIIAATLWGVLNSFFSGMESGDRRIVIEEFFGWTTLWTLGWVFFLISVFVFGTTLKGQREQDGSVIGDLEEENTDLRRRLLENNQKELPLDKD